MKFTLNQKKSALFIVIFVVAFLLISALDRRIRTDDNAAIHKQYFDSLNYVSVLFLGDSHTATSVNMEVSPEGWYNFSYPSDNAFDMFAKFLYAQNQHNLEAIVLPIDYQMVTQFRLKNRNMCKSLLLSSQKDARTVFDLNFFEQMYHNLRCKFPLLIKEEREKFMTAFIQTVREKFGVPKSEESMIFSPYGNWQFAVQQEGSIKDEEQYRQRAEEVVRVQIGEFAPETLILDTYARFIEIAHQQGIKVIGVRYPLDPAFLEFMGERDVSLIDVAVSTLPFDEVFDYKDSYADNTEYFQNPDHMNTKGSESFTRKIQKDFKKELEL